MKESTPILTKITQILTTELSIRGLIQGVGFRPFIYRLALQHQLKGIVQNQNNGVLIQVQGEKANVRQFIQCIKKEKPLASEIDSIAQNEIMLTAFADFSIQKSKKVDQTITRVSPDIAVCSDCLEDMKSQAHRIDYPHTNCTNCGPRFSIIENIPYDRNFTSMKDFDMCPQCKGEYVNVLDRRFHAQPVACNHCGPTYTLHTGNGQIKDIQKILSELSKLIECGGVVAMKGLGGYHLACDAFNEKAIQKLRSLKKRDGKPFALMFRDVDSLKGFANISLREEQEVSSWCRPIVLVESHYKFPKGVADKLSTLGVFLPYMPFHYQLFGALKVPALVMTSGNITHCPIITDNQSAVNTFLSQTSAVLTHNRGIVNRVDDSVIQLNGAQVQLLRRSRSYAPDPITLNFCTEGILAVGAELANTFCMGKGKSAVLSQHIGDLKNLETSVFYEQAIETYKQLFEFEAKHVVCDMHPDYLSTKFAESLELPLIKTQHHHAHIAAAMAEFGLDEPVIGVAYDGTGYGTDGHIWGSEMMVATLSNFERKSHFEYVPVPGGDAVSKYPWRSAVAYLHAAYNGKIPENLDFLRAIDPQELELTQLALEKNINSPLSCSAGRLFDAVSALIGICTHASYHAEAPILLENAIEQGVEGSYSISERSVIDWRVVIKEIVNDLHLGISSSLISAKFHNAIIDVMVRQIKKIHAETGINKVVLSGGTFQNMYISKKVLDLLQITGIKAYMSHRIPVNDGGLSLGQLAIAAKTLALCV